MALDSCCSERRISREAARDCCRHAGNDRACRSGTWFRASLLELLHHQAQITSHSMNVPSTFALGYWRLYVSSLSISFAVLASSSQAAPASGSTNSTDWTTAQDHRNMMEQLGIKALRPGPSGRAGATNEANYDPAKANPFPDLPDPLTLKNGQKVLTPQIWWTQRRPEIVEEFEREVFGRVPKDVPKVTWTVVSNVTGGFVGKLRANGKQLVGRVDNSADRKSTRLNSSHV